MTEGKEIVRKMKWELVEMGGTTEIERSSKIGEERRKKSRKEQKINMDEAVMKS